MKVLTVGSAMIDTIAIIESDRIERMTMRNADTAFLLLEEGRKSEALEISTHCGGGAVNAAVCLSRLGLDVAALIKLGRDARAEIILNRLLAEGVSTRWAQRDGRAPTGASVMISSHERDAAIFTFRGANTLLECNDLRDETFAADLVYISSLSNESAACFPILVAKAKAHGALVAANPGIRQLSARGGAFFDCLDRIDALSINRVEADALVPALVAKFGEGGYTLPLDPGETPPELVARGFKGGGFEMSLAAFFRSVAALGPDYVLLTDGANGAFVGTGDAITFCPALETEVKSTAGAGDAFASTFAGFVVLGHDVGDALQAATVNAGAVISRVDTQTGLLTAKQMAKKLKAHTAELPLRSWRLPAGQEAVPN